MDFIQDNYTQFDSNVHFSLQKIEEITKKINPTLYAHFNKEKI